MSSGNDFGHSCDRWNWLARKSIFQYWEVKCTNKTQDLSIRPLLAISGIRRAELKIEEWRDSGVEETKKNDNVERLV